jgi:hypothetical protein
MLTTIAFVVLITSVLVLFSVELKTFSLKLLKNSWLQLLVPMLIVSLFVVNFEWQLSLFFVSCRIFLFTIVFDLAKLIPFADGQMILEKIIILILITIIPIIAAKSARKHLPLHMDADYLGIFISAFIWSLIAFLLVMNL